MIRSGNGSNALVEDAWNNALRSFTDTIHTLGGPVADADGGNVLMSVGRMRITQSANS